MILPPTRPAVTLPGTPGRDWALLELETVAASGQACGKLFPFRVWQANTPIRLPESSRPIGTPFDANALLPRRHPSRCRLGSQGLAAVDDAGLERHPPALPPLDAGAILDHAQRGIFHRRPGRDLQPDL